MNVINVHGEKVKIKDYMTLFYNLLLVWLQKSTNHFLILSIIYLNCILSVLISSFPDNI